MANFEHNHYERNLEFSSTECDTFLTDHRSYNPDLSSLDVSLFGYPKIRVQGRRFAKNGYMVVTIENYFDSSHEDTDNSQNKLGFFFNKNFAFLFTIYLFLEEFAHFGL